MTAPLGATLRAHKDGGRKFLVAYLMAGSTPTWLETLEALVAAGADAIEVGLPFSDPIIDGPTIQAAATAAIEAGTTFDTVVAALAARAIGVPLVAMTYANIVLARGYDLAALQLAEAGCLGAIIPDLSLKELDDWQRAAGAHGMPTVLLAAPSTPPARLDAICARAQGFLYAVGHHGDDGGVHDARSPRRRPRRVAAAPHGPSGLPRHRGVVARTGRHGV